MSASDRMDSSAETKVIFKNTFFSNRRSICPFFSKATKIIFFLQSDTIENMHGASSAATIVSWVWFVKKHEESFTVSVNILYFCLLSFCFYFTFFPSLDVFLFFFYFFYRMWGCENLSSFLRETQQLIRNPSLLQVGSGS